MKYFHTIPALVVIRRLTQIPSLISKYKSRTGAKVSVLTENVFFVEGDRYLLRRMLENLIQNSISHNEGGCKITLSIKELEDSYQITVADDGTGVSTEKMLHLNLIPDTDDNYMENGEAAHGYGLKLVRQIVKAHQGEIMFRENNPKGFCSEIRGRKIL